MFFSRPRQFIGDAKRLREIIGVFFESGFGYFIVRLQLRYLLPWQKRLWFKFGKRGPEPVFEEELFPPEVHLREVFERLGPTFVKLGQLLSLRPDIVSLEYAKEFEKLQSDVPPFPFSKAKSIIQLELKKPLEKIFKKFDEHPVAAGSLAQVHRAYLKNGTEVAVKVQRPGIKDILTRDIHLMLYLAGLIERHIPESKNFRPVKVVKEFTDWTMRELDFTIEATNADRFRYNLAAERDIAIPKIYWGQTTPRVLVMDFVHGALLNRPKELKKIGVDPKELAARGIRIGFHQFFIDGFFHADPHPGNFFVLADGRLCMHDFGIVGYLSSDERLRFINYLVAFKNKDPKVAAAHLLDFARPENNADPDNFRIFIENELSRWMFGSGGGSLTKAFYHTINAGARYSYAFSTDLVLLGKALMTTEAMIYELDPDFDIAGAVSDFVGVLYKEELRPEKLIKSAEIKGGEYLAFLRELPERTMRLLQKLEGGEIGVKVNLEEVQDLKKEFDRQNDVRVLSLVVVALFLGSAVVLRMEQSQFLGDVSLGKIGAVSSLVLLVWLLILVKRGINR